MKNKIAAIRKVRSDNNRLWVRLLELALIYAPKEAKKVLRKINQNDRKISRLLGKVANE